MKSFFIIFFMFGIQSLLFSQAKNGFKFTSINQAGFIIESKNNGFKIESINGLKYKNWSVGIGIGVDWQGVRSAPLFLDVRKNFGHKKDNLFIYGDVGKNIWWDNSTGNDLYIKNTPLLNTYFAEAGVGYSFHLKKKSKFFSSVGYGNKEIAYKTSYVMVYEFPPYINTYDNYYKWSTYLNRLVFKLGFQF